MAGDDFEVRNFSFAQQGFGVLDLCILRMVSHALKLLGVNIELGP